MKKIIFILLAVISLDVGAQSFTEDIDTLFGDYQYEYLYGSISRAEKKAYNLIQVVVAHNNLLWSIGTDDATTRTSALSDLNSLLGTSYPLPTVDFDQTAQSYLAVDSINVGGQGYLDSLTTWPGVLYAIETYNILTTSDSSWVRSEISDSLDDARAQLRSDMVDSIAAADSTWVTVTVDTLKWGNTTALINKTGANGIDFTSAGVLGFKLSGYSTLSGQSNGFEFPNTSTNDIRLLPNQSDGNTGFTWESADKLELQAGDSAIAWFYELGEKPIAEINDSLIVGGESDFLDSLSLNYAIDAEGDEQWVGLSAAGKLFADSITTARYGYTDPLPNIFNYLHDKHNGETKWGRYDRNTGKVVYEYGLSDRPTEAVAQLQWGIEHAFRYIRQLWIFIGALTFLVLLLFGIIILKK